MKQKAINTSPVTKEELKAILKDYPTKTDLSERLNAGFEAFRQENNHNFQMMMDRFDERFSKFTNLILNAIDPLLKDLETRREDREIAAAEMRDIKARLAKLENS